MDELASVFVLLHMHIVGILYVVISINSVNLERIEFKSFCVYHITDVRSIQALHYVSCTDLVDGDSMKPEVRAISEFLAYSLVARDGRPIFPDFCY